MEWGGNQEYWFLICCQKVAKQGSEKGSLIRQIPALNFTLEQFTFGILENQELKPPVDSSGEAAFTYPRQKSIIFRTKSEEVRTTDFLVPTDGKSAQISNLKTDDGATAAVALVHRPAQIHRRVHPSSSVF